MKKKFGLKIVFDKETNIMKYKAKWWLKYLPLFVLNKLLENEIK